MRKNKKRNCVFILCVSMLLGLCGCRDEAVFVDVQEASWSESGQKMAQTQPVSEDAAAEQTQAAMEQAQLSTEQEVPDTIIVHVCGAVVNPGVYELDAGSRVMDAVDSAGGLLENASLEYVNLASPISDGDKITLPTEEEASYMKQQEESAAPQVITSPAAQLQSGQNGQTQSGKININTADKELLCTLPGIGNTRADSIIAYREEHGKFSSIEDIMQVSGIKDSSFQKIKDYIIAE